ncbi:hypothetical protein GJ496_008838 [Pomphorhynchus laevis]|nr:hypothetical protein GJ496_008838 [Pomphorhynchus laevis]
MRDDLVIGVMKSVEVIDKKNVVQETENEQLLLHMLLDKVVMSTYMETDEESRKDHTSVINGSIAVFGQDPFAVFALLRSYRKEHSLYIDSESSKKELILIKYRHMNAQSNKSDIHSRQEYDGGYRVVCHVIRQGFLDVIFTKKLKRG